MMKLFCLLMVALGVVACSSAPETDSVTNSVVVDSGFVSLPDSLFVLRDVKNSECIRQFDWDGQDSSAKKKLVRIDSATVVKLLCPLGFIKWGEYSYYMTSFFYVSKQKTVGNIQPIIIWGNGDDYSELLLVTLDKKGTPIDHYSLYKNDCAGTWTVEDSLMGTCPVEQARFEFDKIHKCVNIICYRLDSIGDPINDYARIDSISYEANILLSGKIESKQVDSVRFNRSYVY